MFITTDELLERVEALEKLLRPQYILIKDAAIKYGLSYRTIKKKASKYKVRRLKAGKVKNNPIFEPDLINALSKQEPKPKVFNTKMR